MNFQQMERILFIIEEGTISDAAKKLYVSQPTLSIMISSMEKEIGLKIFDRKSTYLKLTEEGEKYVTTIKKILNTWSSFNSDLTNTNRGILGTVKIGISQRRSVAMLPNILSQFTKDFPSHSIKIINCKTSTTQRMLMDGSVDIAFGNYFIDYENITNIHLNDEQIFLTVSKISELLKKISCKEYNGGKIGDNKVKLSELKNETFIVLDPQEDERIRYENIIQEAKISPLTLVEVFSSRIAECLVENGVGCALLPKIMTRNYEITDLNQNLSYFGIDSIYSSRKFYMSFDNSRLNIALKHIVSMVISNFGFDDQLILNSYK